MKELVPAVAPAAAPSTAEERGKRAAGLTPLLVTVVEAKNLPLKDVSSKTDPFVTVEAAGIKSQTDVQRGAAEDVTLDQLEKSITQEPSQCDEREVEEAT